MKKRLVCVLLATVMLVGSFAGCGKDGDSDSGKQQSGSNKLVIGIPNYGDIADYEENAFTKYVEEALDIELSFQIYVKDATERQQQLNMQAVSMEELPDVLWGFQETPLTTIYEFGEAGYFQDLTELIEDYAPNYKAALAKLTEEEIEYIETKGTAFDGKFYGMPMYCSFEIQDQLENMIYINKTWLDKLNLSIPTDVESLRKVLEAFKTEDPNGNGVKDEIPMLGRNISSYVINAYQYFLSSNMVDVIDGEVYAAYTTDEYREALIYLNELCEDGLYSDMSITLTSSSEFMALITPNQGVARVGIWCGHPLSYTDTTSPILDEYVALKALEGESEKGGYLAMSQKELIFSAFITKDCENPELAMKFLDFFYVDETVTCMRWGEKDVDWKEATGKSVTGSEAKFEVIDEDANLMSWGINGHCITTPENYLGVMDLESSVGRLCYESCQVFQAEDANVRKPEMARAVYTSEEYERKAKLEQIINGKASSNKDLFITGGLDPADDKTWNKYLSDLEEQGLQELLEIYQKAYDRN